MVIVWQSLFGLVFGATIRWPESFVVGTSVWLAYAADRWIEGWRLPSDRIQTPRHRFYHEHRWSVAIVWCALLATDIVIALVELSRRELIAGFVLLTPTLLYLLSHQLIHRNHPWRVPKELCVAGLIAGGASVFVFADPQVSPAMLLLPVLLFAAVCFTNVALIATWEEEVDEQHGQESLARKFRHGPRFSRLLPFAVIAIAVLAALALGRGRMTIATCVGASAALLLTVDRIEPAIGRQLARVLADVTLLTALVPLLVHLLR